MGVSGCGKTTVGALLSQKTGIQFYDGDDFHPKANVDKMASGQALNDEDRNVFLNAINSKMRELKAQNQSGIFACSALKEIYRNWLSVAVEHEIRFVYLKGREKLISKRLAKRTGHFMPPNLLKSQLETLEEPRNTLTFSIAMEPEVIAEEINIEMTKSEFGLVGLGVMGKSIARNLARNGVKLSLFNRFVAGKEENVAENFVLEYPELELAKGFEDLKLFVKNLQQPKKIFLMIQAGQPTDVFLSQLTPLLSKGDIVIDGGNSYFEDTKKRQKLLADSDLNFIGTGVSGGESGALNGPSIMPSGDSVAYSQVQPFLESITAQDYQGGKCCTYIGPEGSGHFVKMVHNGIEYAEMQILAEVYAIMRFSFGYLPNQISEVLKEWNKTDLKNYLLEITADILSKKEGETWVIDGILDKAGNKGTGNWSSITAIENGQPATMISSALFARYISTIKENNSHYVENKLTERIFDQESILNGAYELARKINHDQGFKLISSISIENKWALNLSEIARIWTNGCIIRSTLMEQLSEHFKANESYIDYHIFSESNQDLKPNLKASIINAVTNDIPIPCFSAALNFLVAMESKIPTANIIQAQRDYFGAHTYQKAKDPSGKYYHTDWQNL
jgi:6-phosphogluconate dehydrogenase